MEQIVMARIAELLSYRRWWRSNRWADWPEIRTAHEIELRALVRLARAFRRVEAAKPDPLDQAKSFAEWSAWTEGEKVASWGR